MTHEHASFFSGVGGTDLGLERAGWRTVSFSEIDPYASAVLAERWPGIPNLGDITELARLGRLQPTGHGGGRTVTPDRLGDRPPDGSDRIPDAELWTGGFPCQDLSVAGKRRGMVEGSRSNLAHAFLDLVERHRPPAILLENVPGLLSSHRGRDMATLLGRMAELGYGVAYRILDARHFGVPQRRRRVFILGLRSGPDDPTGRVAAECAAQVLAVGTRCLRHPPTGVEAGPGAADRTGASPDIVGTVPAGLGHHGNGGHSSQAVAAGHVISPEAYAHRVRTPDELAGRLDDREVMGSLREHVRPGSNTDYSIVQEIAATILAPNGGPRTTDLNNELVAFVKAGRAQTSEDAESWKEGSVMPTLNAFDVGDVRTTAAILGTASDDDPLLPLGLDSHRYRCAGNGVVANVAYWLGLRILRAVA